MKCPYCQNDMVKGLISQDRYAIKWVPAEKDKGILNFTPLVKGIKITSLMDAHLGPTRTTYYCPDCEVFIIHMKEEP